MAKIYDIDGKIIGSGDHTRGNLFYPYMNETTYLFV